MCRTGYFGERTANTRPPCFAALAARGPLRSWQPRWVVEYVAGHPGWSPRTVQMLLVALRTFAKWARRRGYDCPDLARDVEGPRVTKAQRAAYSVGELRAVLDVAAAHPYAPAVYLAALAGLSLGDLRRLTWGEVDLRGGLDPRAAVQDGAGPPHPHRPAPARRAGPGLLPLLDPAHHGFLIDFDRASESCRGGRFQARRLLVCEPERHLPAEVPTGSGRLGHGDHSRRKPLSRKGLRRFRRVFLRYPEGISLRM